MNEGVYSQVSNVENNQNGALKEEEEAIKKILIYTYSLY